jgi:hypothetical protein
MIYATEMPPAEKGRVASCCTRYRAIPPFPMGCRQLHATWMQHGCNMGASWNRRQTAKKTPWSGGRSVARVTNCHNIVRFQTRALGAASALFGLGDRKETGGAIELTARLLISSPGRRT